MRNTRQDILQTSLTLFSQRGFSNVSIRDICKEVGIKESTVYYHFQNKQDIFETLLSDFRKITALTENRFSRELAKITRVGEEPFIAVGLCFLSGYLLDEQILKFVRMLMIEQHGNDQAAQLYHQLLFEAPLKENAAVFQKLIQMGCFQDCGANAMAMEYYAPVFLVFNRYFASGEVTPESRKKADALLTVHFQNFYKRYCIQDAGLN